MNRLLPLSLSFCISIFIPLCHIHIHTNMYHVNVAKSIDEHCHCATNAQHSEHVLIVEYRHTNDTVEAAKSAAEWIQTTHENYRSKLMPNDIDR